MFDFIKIFYHISNKIMLDIINFNTFTYRHLDKYKLFIIT